jgi:hypothetical protein
MPTNLTEFGDDTAFERYVLDRAVPLLPRLPATSVIYLEALDSTSVAVTPQPATVHVSVADSVGVGEDQLRADDIRPLLFGAAWKVLDQLIELSLEQAKVSHDRGSNYSIGCKCEQAATGNVRPVPPFDGRPDLWTRAMTVYAATAEIRHSLVHRRLVVSPSTGDIRGVARSGMPSLKPFTVAEQLAFCQAACGVAEAVTGRDLPTRRAEQLAWTLDELTSHHGQPSLGASPARGVIPRVVVNAESSGPSGEVTLDFGRLRTRARAAVGDVSYYDLEIRLPDGRVLTGPLEDAPSGSLTFSVDAPPDWLSWA